MDLQCGESLIPTKRRVYPVKIPVPPPREGKNKSEVKGGTRAPEEPQNQILILGYASVEPHAMSGRALLSDYSH